MKLKVYQQGGGLIYTPFIPEQNAVTSSSSKSSSSSDEDPKIDPLDKELLALMKDQELLPSDIDTIYKQLVLFQKRSQNLSSSAGFGGTDAYRSVMPGMLQIMSLASKAKYEKSKANDVENRLRSENAWADPALDSNGRMYVKDIETDKITLINPSDFDKEKYIPISNSQLLSYREQSAGFNTNLLNDLQQAVGMTSVSKEIDRIIKAFGTAETENYIDKETAQALQMLNGTSPEGIYKLSQKKTSADMQKALMLIYNQLPANMQQALNARASISNTTPGELVRDILLSNLSYKTGIDYDSTATKASGIGGSGGSGDGDEKNLTEYSYIENLATGRNFELPTYTTFNPVSTVSLHAAIQNTGSLMRKDGVTPVGAGMVDSIFETVEGLKQISPQYTVTFGDQILDETAQGALMYDGSALQRVKLPYTEVNGEVTVNWKLVEQLEEANKQLQEKGATPGMIQELIADNPELVYNRETGMIESVNSMWFLTFGAMIGHDFVDGLDTNSRYIERMNQDKADFWHHKYEEAAQYGFVNHDKNAPKRTDAPTDKGFLGRDWSRTRYYHGNVFVPILNELAGATQYYSKNNHMHNAQTQAMNNRDLQIQQEVNSGKRSFNW